MADSNHVGCAFGPPSRSRLLRQIAMRCFALICTTAWGTVIRNRRMPPGATRGPLEDVLEHWTVSPPYPAPRNALRGRFDKSRFGRNNPSKVSHVVASRGGIRVKELERVCVRARTRWHASTRKSNAFSAYRTSRLDLDSGPGIAPTVVEIHHSSAQTTFRGYWGGYAAYQGEYPKPAKTPALSVTTCGRKPVKMLVTNCNRSPRMPHPMWLHPTITPITTRPPGEQHGHS